MTSSYFYRADGTKLKKTYVYGYKGGTERTTTTEYIDGFQYETNNTIQALQFVPTSEGYFNFVNNTYIYQYKDHLGNVRVTYHASSGNAVIKEESDYYPFGLRHSSTAITNSAYTYQYNSKELQTDSGMYDYGARFYMPELGRWGVVDSLAEMTRRFSPYVYGNSNPMRFTDPDGRHSIDNLQGGYTSGSTVASFLGSFGGDFSGFMPSYFSDEQGEVYANRSSSYEGGGSSSSAGFSWKSYISTLFAIYNLDLMGGLNSSLRNFDQTGEDPPGKVKKAANKIREIGDAAAFIDAMDKSLRGNSKILGKFGKIGGYLSAGGQIIYDGVEYHNGEISGYRFSFRLGTTVTAAVVGAEVGSAIGGPGGFVVGTTIGTSAGLIESAWNVLWPQFNQSFNGFINTATNNWIRYR